MSFIYTNPNPLKRNVGDCTVRAISICEGLSWEEVYLSLCIMGFLEADMPSSNAITDNGSDNNTCAGDKCAKCKFNDIKDSLKGRRKTDARNGRIKRNVM